MDATSKKKKDCCKNNQGYSIDSVLDNPEDEKTKKKRTQDLKAKEEELRSYEEKVFIDNVVESTNVKNRKQFSRDYDEVRKKYTNGTCPYYNGGEKRIFETELNINPFFEKMAAKVLNQSVYDIEDLNKIGKMHSLCPYYLARSKLSNVDICIIP